MPACTQTSQDCKDSYFHVQQVAHYLGIQADRKIFSDMHQKVAVQPKALTDKGSTA